MFSHLSEKRVTQQGFFAPDKLENHTSKGKGKVKEEDRRRREKSIGYTLSFNNIYSGDGFWSGEIYLIGGNIFKNPAKYILS